MFQYYKRNQQMKQMQKIAANLKHKHRNLRIRFSLQDQFKQVTQRLKVHCSEEQVLILSTLFRENSGNVRQRLKVIKRALQSKEEKDFSQKKLVAHNFVDLHLKEYVFGNTQSKPSLMNVLKIFHSVIPIGSHKIYQAVDSIAIEEYGEARNIFQLLEYFAKSESIQNVSLMRQKFKMVQNILFTQFQNCYNIIFSEGFKLKWMQHFVDVMRTLNVFFKLYKSIVASQTSNHIIKLSRQIVTQYKVLTKEVLTQLFILILSINPDQQAPLKQQGSCLIHYYHAQNVVSGRNIMKNLIELLPHIKQTQYKCQLVPILLKAFQQHYSNYPDKANVFDQVVTLFDVGRSVYSYLEQIVSIIIKDPQAVWNLEGTYLRKFFIATVALKHIIPTHVLFKQWPTIIEDVITQAGSMTIAYASDCAKFLFQRLYEQSNKQYQKWSSIWMKQYQKALLSQDRGHVRGIIQFINPILLEVNSQPILLKEIMQLSKHQNSVAMQMGVIALLKCYKDLGKIFIDNPRRTFIHIDDATIQFAKDQIKILMLSSDSTMGLKALQFVTVHPKGSQPMEPLQLELALQFYKNCIKTSLPEYRKSYLTATKKMLERLRTTYDTQLTKTAQELKKNKRFKPKNYLAEFKIFLSNLIDLCYQNVFPDVIFELANPALQILLLVGQFFSRKQIQIKKGQIYEATTVLTQTNFFKPRNFDNLLCCLQSSYESVRELAHHILELFYDLNDEKKLKSLWHESLTNANKLTIKSYEYACRILALISQVYPQFIDLPNRYEMRQLNICHLFLNIIRQRYQIFKVQFATQQENYYQNLIHGMLTVFSYTLDHLSSKIRSSPQHFVPHFSSLKLFLTEFFELINQIVLFSVQVCSSNISTVVLDSLPQSQTDKKYKVDCRGHFLQETNKGISGLIQSTALLTSMENEEQGIQNTLVVSFYLLTREAGLVFQSISNITATAHSQQYLPVQSLVQLVNSYFYALINLKHMGSVDRIAGGLGKMARLIFDNEDKRLSQLPDKLLEKLVSNLRDGNFTNILRRSAGVPYAFTCLLKNEAIKRKQMIQKTVSALLELSSSQQAKNIELRIHSLNILKKIFQDGDLKGDLQCYVSKAFIFSIVGFTSEEWGVRNSSLMLFTVLANRSVGIKPTYNLLQFFHRCPDLLDFFSQQLHNLRLNTMYPPLYPIVLLLSRLLPFDLSQRVKLPNKGELNLKQIRKDRLLELLPLIQKAGINSNHMGRVMAAKAILPFMDIQGIIPYCLSKLKNIREITHNNILHYTLTATYNLLLSLHEIQQNQKYYPKLSQLMVEQILETLKRLGELICRKQSAVVSESLLKLIHHLLNHFQIYIDPHQDSKQVKSSILNVTTRIIDHYFTLQNLQLQMNMGNSAAIKQCLSLHMHLLGQYKAMHDVSLIQLSFQKFMAFLTQKLTNNPLYLLHADTQIIQTYLQQLTAFISSYKCKESLEQRITALLNSLSLKEIASDAVLIKVIQLRAFLKITITIEDEAFLNKSVEKTQNHFLKIQIFKYFQSTDLNHSLLQLLVSNFSRPEQLQQLRQCCVQYFQVYPQLNPQHYIAYIRLLQDQQYEIRLETAKILAKKLDLAEINEEVIKNLILSKINIHQFQQLLLEVSDFEIKRRNYQQERIFSYDKPNKYRSDITNVLYCLLHNENIKNRHKQLPQVVAKAFQLQKLDWRDEGKCIGKYLNDIVTRNQYQFQIILRIYLLNNSQYVQQFQQIFKEHPLLQKVYAAYPYKTE